VADVGKNIRSGGTELSSVAKFYTTNKLKSPQAMLYFTDGYVEGNPQVLKDSRNIFMIFSWGSDETLIKAKAGTVYNINL
jgi:predicted metal-dependent peptidase